MHILKQTIPLAIALSFGLLALFGLVIAPEQAGLNDLLLGWVSFIAAFALLIGSFNLLGVHLKRLTQGNGYSGVLILGMLAVFGIAITDYLELTENWLTGIFHQVQAPLESALASLLVFFVLFAGFRLLKRRLSWWSVLFIVSAILFFMGTTPLPTILSNAFGSVSDLLAIVFVNAGMRGILLGVALGTVTVSLRILAGRERPYNK